MSDARNLRAILILQEMSLKEFSVLSNVPYNTLTAAIKRNGNFNENILCKIAETLELSADYIRNFDKLSILNFRYLKDVPTNDLLDELKRRCKNGS